jgi:NAD(P)-dependent dehydrogenase (short-subunit alcohol dehydrogenase family)
MAPRTSSLITGATGFIGKRLMERLVLRGGRLWVLIRESSLPRSRGRIEAWRRSAERTGAEIHVLTGDLALSGLGLRQPLPSGLDHVFHLAADYHLETPEPEARAANVDGLQHLLDALGSAEFEGVFHHVSSIAVAGDFEGTFTEEMLEAGQSHLSPYLKTKFEAERLVRSVWGLRCRIYRPGAVVGDSRTGEMDKIDGPYFLFKPIQRLRRVLPAWVPLAAPSQGSFNIVPVDFVAAALDHIAHAPSLDGQTFHLVDPNPLSPAQILDLFLKAAAAPRIRWMWKPSRSSPLQGVVSFLAGTASLRFLLEQYCMEWSIPVQALDSFNPRVRFDEASTRAALAGSGISCPPLASYADKLWAYWELHLDPDRHKLARLQGLLPGKRILITGASSGIGEALALECGRLGAHVILVARRAEKLDELASAIRASGGRATALPADLGVLEDCDRVVQRCIEESGAPDVLVLNAAKSIRRSLAQTRGRFHDLQRTMQLNYFGAARLAMGFLPAMRQRRSGHIVHSSTWGVLYPGPRYAAYLASKAALDTFLDSLASEFLSEGIRVSQVYLPWVRTPMVAPTQAVAETKMLSPEQAAGLILEAILEKPRTMAPPQAYWTVLGKLFTPKSATRVLNLLYRLFPDEEGQHPELEPERQFLKRYIQGSPL